VTYATWAHGRRSPDGTEVSWTYDGLGRLASRSEDGQTAATYGWLGQRLLESTTPQGERHDYLPRPDGEGPLARLGEETFFFEVTVRPRHLPLPPRFP